MTRDEASQTLTVSTTHLSDSSMLAGLQIRPLGATVKTGQSLELTVKTCLTE